jgi:hypothetical protein
MNMNEDWGFYVDIEKENCVDSFKEKNIKPKQLILPTDYYDYYDEYHQDYCEDYYKEYKSIPINHNVTNLLIKLSSTTLATIGLTYLLFCIL